ncbi:MAG: hypothetical protein Q4B26_03910 [Eubacteriales bacterium]|nr:hypothetical protein [Eubacteriales bacterium]
MMMEVKTDSLLRQAEQMRKTAGSYHGRIENLESCMNWMRQQETQEMEVLYHVLERSRRDLEEQQHQMRSLAEGLQRVCELYKNTEDKIVGNSRGIRIVGYKIQRMNLKGIRSSLEHLGFVIGKQ